MDKDTFEILARVILALIGVGLFFLILNIIGKISFRIENLISKKYIDKYIPNGKNRDILLGTFFGTGLSLCGGFDRHNGPKVYYYCFTVLTFPILPFMCLRADFGNSQTKHVPYRVEETTYTIYGTDKWNMLEVLLLYVRTILIIALLYLSILYIDNIIMVDSDTLFDIWIDVFR